VPKEEKIIRVKIIVTDPDGRESVYAKRWRFCFLLFTCYSHFI